MEEDYYRIMLEKIWKKNEKRIAIILFIILLLSIIPIISLSFYNFAAGDDFSFGEFTRAAWVSSHSLIEVVKAMLYKVQTIWHSWQGTWFTVALMSLQPEVFSRDGYWITTWILLTVIIATTFLLTHYFLVKRLQMQRSAWISISSLLLLAMIQFFPNIQSALFWWNGGMHYIIPYGLALIGVYSLFSFSDTGKKRYLILLSVCAFCLGGSSYLAPLALLILFFYLLIYAVYTKKLRKEWFWLIIPITIELCGLVISMISPGNKVRGGEDFGFSFSLVIETIWKCFVEGTLVIGTYVEKYPAILLAFIAIAIVSFEAFMVQDAGENRFPLPIVFCMAMYCLHCAMYAPGIYSGVSLSGGIPNTIYQCFLLATTFSIIYVMGWLAEYLKRREDKRAIIVRRGLWIVFAICFINLAFHFSSLFDSSFYACHDYIGDGYAAEFKEQMEERHSMLIDSEERIVTLPSVDGRGGPIMHMDINMDPNDWQNKALCRFYDKDVVYKIDRDEYEAGK